MANFDTIMWLFIRFRKRKWTKDKRVPGIHPIVHKCEDGNKVTKVLTATQRGGGKSKFVKGKQPIKLNCITGATKAKGKPWLGRISSPLCQTTKSQLRQSKEFFQRNRPKTFFFFYTKVPIDNLLNLKSTCCSIKISPWKVTDKPLLRLLSYFVNAQHPSIY